MNDAMETCLLKMAKAKTFISTVTFHENHAAVYYMTFN